jgi:hypothetical protein
MGQRKSLTSSRLRRNLRSWRRTLENTLKKGEIQWRSDPWRRGEGFPKKSPRMRGGKPKISLELPYPVIEGVWKRFEAKRTRGI